MSEVTRDLATLPSCCLAELVSRRRRILPPEEVYPIDPWRLVERRFYPRLLAQTETLFATSNGYLGIRATPEEGSPIHESGTYLNGFYESWPIVYAEEAYGFAKSGQTMLPVPDGTLLKLHVDGEPFDLSRALIVDFERVLDLRSGTLEREVCFETAARKRLRIRSQRLVSLEHRNLACLSYEVTLLAGRADLTLSSELVVSGPHGTNPGGDPRATRQLDASSLISTEHRARGRRVLFTLETQNSGLSMACAMDHVLEADCAVGEKEAECIQDRGRVVFRAEAEEGQRLRVIKFLAYHHDAAVDRAELASHAERTLDRAVADGLPRILADQRQRVAEFWETSDVEIGGDPQIQQAVRFNLFQILQATARVEGCGVPAKGLTGLGYEGHYFWDTEIYVLPFLTYSRPEVARSLLLHRHTQLPRARARAREVGERGALFPWRTINGDEASAYYAAGTAQYHINADIVFAADRYVRLTGDLEFLAGGFAEITVETARLWAHLGFYSDRKDGRFCIHGVTGPDEYNTVVNNNAYTNLMARENLLTAVRTVEFLRRHAPEAYQTLARATGLGPEEPAEWRRAAEQMYVPYDADEGVHLQDDAFLDRERWDFDGTPPEHYPLLLHYHPLVIYRHQVIKQADIVLATFLLGDRFSDEEKRRIFDYYDPLTTGDSSLSLCVQSIMAAEFGDCEKVCRYFADAVVMDLGDIGGNVKDGLHIASLGGTWMALVHGFAGLRDRDGRLRFAPWLPPGWQQLRFRLRAHEELVEVDIRPGQTRYTLRAGRELELWHAEERVVLSSDEPIASRATASADACC